MALKKGQPPKGQELDAEDYFAAAQDHAAALAATYKNQNYVLTVYVSGLAVECLFRAFRHRKGLPFTSEHKLARLAEEAEFSELVPEMDRAAYDADLAELVVRWRNDHRFRSIEALRRFLKGLKLDRGIRGNYVKENARLISSAAIRLLGLGVQRWQK